jgi:hypothetical protein
MEKSIAVIKKDKKGFWQADLYKNGLGADFPNDYFTMSSGRSAIDVMHAAKRKWPNARIDLIEQH